MGSGGADLYIIGAVVGSIAAYFYGLGQYRLKKFIEYTPISKAVAVAPGIAEVQGIAQKASNIYTSPLQKKPCVYYRTNIYKWSGSGKRRKKSLVSTLESKEPFYLSDDTGKVLVLPFFSENSSFLGSLFSGLLKGSMSKDLVGLDKKYSGSPKKFGFLGALLNKPSTDQNLAPFLAQHCPSLSNYADKVEIEEKFIEEGDSIFLIGQAQEVEKEGRVQMMICKGKDKGAFCIADGTEKSALSSISFWTYVVLAFSPIAFAASFALLLFRFRVLDFGTEIFAAFVVACMYLYVFVVMLMEYYNSMFILKNGVEKASANVDALVKRRADLIPNLVEAIKAYSKYEKGIMNDIAAIRQGSADQAKQLFVLAENYPKLKASDNYKALSWELAHTENWIAGARTYVSESIALYNTRIGSFPYLLFAPFFGLRPIDCGKSTE